MAIDPISAGLAGGGALLGGLSSLFNKRNKTINLPRLSPQQMASQNQLLNTATADYQNPYAGFDPLAQKARTQFSTQTVPSIAERFTSMGNGQRSSAFQGALGQAASGLEENLAALQSQYGLDSRSRSLQALQLGLQPQFDSVYREGGPSVLSGILRNLGAGAAGLGSIGLYTGLMDNNNQSQQSTGALNQDSLKQLLDLLNNMQQQQGGGSGAQGVAQLQSQTPTLPVTGGQGQQNFESALRSLLSNQRRY